MKTASGKAKGRRLQKMVCEDLLRIAKSHNAGIDGDDIRSTPMGSNGVDVQFSSSGRRLFNLSIECKNRESLNVHKEFMDHCVRHEKDRGKKILVHSRNRSEALVTLKWSDFLEYVSDYCVEQLR